MTQSEFLELYAQTLDLQARFCAVETRETLSSLESFRNAEEILEVGCGAGAQIGILADLISKKRYCGIDITPEFINIAKTRFASLPNVRLAVQDVLSFVPKRRYEFLLSWAVLQHLPDTEKAVKKYSQLLRPGGVMVLYDSNSNDEFKSSPALPTLHALYQSLSEERTGGKRKSRCLEQAASLAPKLGLRVLLNKQSTHETKTQESRDLSRDTSPMPPMSSR